MGFGYDKLPLQIVSVQPLASINSPDLASRPHFSSITKGGGGGIAVGVNKASGPCRPTKGEFYKAGGRWPWHYEGKSSLGEQATNAIVLAVVAQLCGFCMFHLNFGFWKAFHQWNYHVREILATMNTVPEGLLDGTVAASIAVLICSV